MAKDIQLLGIGNALVDVQVQIGHDDLERLGLRKGGMDLVDAEAQRRILDQFAHLPSFRCSGGSAANTIIAFSQFGGRAGYGSLLGDDHHGEFYASEFESLGIHLFAERHTDEATGTCLVLITPDAERTMNTSLAANTKFTREHITEEAIKRAEWLYIEGYKFSEQDGAEAVEHAIYYARRHDTKIAVTFSDLFIVEHFNKELRQSVEAADLLFCNETEGRAFTGSETNDEAFRGLKELAPSVAFTMGDQGSLVQFKGKDVRIPAYDSSPTDTTGAGDMYAAGFLYGILHDYSAESAGHLASHAAAKVVSQLGARLKTEEVHDVKQRVGERG